MTAPATHVLMPALSPKMKSGTLVRWLVEEGAAVAAGDILAEVETDKATMEVEAAESGVLLRRLAAEGENVAVGAPIAAIAPAPRPAPAAAPTAKAKTAPERARPRLTVREALRQALAEEMRRDPDVFLLGEEIGAYQGSFRVTQGLLEEFGPKRVVDAPIVEHAFAGLGVGAAFAGLKPVIEFMSFNFVLQALDHIVNSAAKTLYMSGGALNCPIVFRGPNGASARVGAQHAQDYAAWFAHVPGLKVVAPYTAADAKGLLKAAIRDPNPVVFLEHERLYGESFDAPDDPEALVDIGVAAIARRGEDATLVAFSRGVALALQAAEQLAGRGVNVEVVDLRTLRPLDMGCVLESVGRTGRCVVVEEGWPRGGIGAEIAARLMEEAFEKLRAPVRRVTAKDVPAPYAANLEEMARPQLGDVLAALEAVLHSGFKRSGCLFT
ncbi:pyruvate dehydrogenase E1 component beta subunit [Rhodoblastus acidophilus]|uniref:Pyruvate dehydrogenase E1 component subunit beta n=2 Tax=Rhodoblastus acidophilus TaxID=1074 RepID=A0A212RI32_RHOAC|nr:pyruvate dehydrogenase complex E1 component subunit beta [Rhodoblastus acidophilus]PPQ38069.1 pyruvate dehydrogenase complex E1 component subunit beta [Rhodoblastus acidophilus]SNB72100.1 pyruvate dehydrogenase E1 component beta subunit [Rhodoblastus acidophilus]